MCEACDRDGSNVDIVIEFPAAGETYSHEEYGVYAYGEYESWSVNAGQVKRSSRGTYETLEEAQSEHPKAKWSGEEGSGFVHQEPPMTPPPGFDPAYAGERWDSDY